MASSSPMHGATRQQPRAVTVAIVGAGSRGKTYARYAVEHPELMQVVAVAEPRPFHRQLVAKRFGIPDRLAFDDWQKLAALDRIADAVVIATQDHMHVGPCVALADKGYHVLLEKPMAVTAHDCRLIVDAVKRNGVVLAVGHVLRYTPYMQKMKALISQGVIGEVVNVQHLEPIGNWHFAHSYVRGAWRREDESTFMLMAKCCHDVDLIRYIMGRPCTRVSSFGSLTHFKKAKKPAEAGAATRCLDCALADSCPYSAKTVYLQRAQNDYFSWPVSVVVDGQPSAAAVEAALRTGPYGRCVWECDNDVADHQVVSMEFEGGASATLTTAAFTEAICQRRTRVFGSLGELNGDGDSTIRHFDFRTGKATVHTLPGAPEGTGITGHNGADFYLIQAFIKAVGTGDPTAVLSGPEETLESHLIVFAAEAARRAGVVVSVPDVLGSGIAAAVASATAVAVGAKVAASSQAMATPAAPSPPTLPPGPLGSPIPHTASPLGRNLWGAASAPMGLSSPLSTLTSAVLPAGSTVTAHIAPSSAALPTSPSRAMLGGPHGGSLVTVSTSGGGDEADVVLPDTPTGSRGSVPLMTTAVTADCARGLGAVPVSAGMGMHLGGGGAVNSMASLSASPGMGLLGQASPALGGMTPPTGMAHGMLPAAISVRISSHPAGVVGSPTLSLPRDTSGTAMVPVAAAVGSVLGAIHSVTHPTPRATAVGEPFAHPHAATAGGVDTSGEDLLLADSPAPLSPLQGFYLPATSGQMQ